MSEKGEWIRLLVKYRGKCVQCGKEIPAGEYALWSKSSKAIRHEKCEIDAASDVESKGSVIELECFVCGNSAGCAQCGFEADCNRALVSQACICSQCLAKKDAYDDYQQAFIARMRKIAKVRI